MPATISSPNEPIEVAEPLIFTFEPGNNTLPPFSKIFKSLEVLLNVLAFDVLLSTKLIVALASVDSNFATILSSVDT